MRAFYDKVFLTAFIYDISLSIKSQIPLNPYIKPALFPVILLFFKIRYRDVRKMGFKLAFFIIRIMYHVGLPSANIIIRLIISIPVLHGIIFLIVPYRSSKPRKIIKGGLLIRSQHIGQLLRIFPFECPPVLIFLDLYLECTRMGTAEIIGQEYLYDAFPRIFGNLIQCPHFHGYAASVRIIVCRFFIICLRLCIYL